VSDSGELGVALVGFGLAGGTFHGPLVAATPGLAVRAVVTHDPERASRARSMFPGVRIVPSADELWGDVAGLDVAVVATANRAHVPVSRDALEAGLAVVLDKPMAPDLAGAREVVAAAERAGRPLTVFQNRRWDADFVTLRALLERGEIGRVHRFESRWDRWRPRAKEGAWRERGGADEGGGILLDLGPHLVDQALVLFGAAESVYAEVAARRNGVEADDDVFVALRHASGTVSHLWASQIDGDEGRRLRVLGARAAWIKAGLDPQEAALRAGETPGGPGWGVESEAWWGEVVAGDARRITPGLPGDHGAFYRGLVAALRDGEPLPVTGAEGLAVMEVLDAARRSAASGEVVAL
jgi:scyllo-inositol 2-dehydrogenase (NADP+)